ncbi:MAG: flagellar basal body rod protein FlgB [Phycisphaerales bacterium]|nr:flagellar basal body rod protein FlgB [Phycisphaerales bacterium]
MIEGVTNGLDLPVLERVIQFAARRQDIIVNNIANISTPDFRPVDVSTSDFQAQLGDAIDQRRGSGGGDLPMQSTREVQVTEGGLQLNPGPSGDNLLFHDGNDRDLERIMQDLVQNFLVFRTTSELLQNRFDILNTAIRGRI